MARFFVVRRATAERLPFLRGILVQSLVNAGLSFQDAYLVAQVIRDDLGKMREISTDELHRHVARELDARFGPRVREAYERGPESRRQILISKDGHSTVFSVGLVTRSLEACAIDRNAAFGAARRAQQTLREAGAGIVDHLELRRIIYQSLRGEGEGGAADRYLSWRLFRNSGEPLILLIGGVPGTGKSTMASELGYRLNIVRTQSTDMMRELIRCYLGREAAPTLGYSSFEAWRGLGDIQPVVGQSPSRSRVIAGFLTQFADMKAGLEATIQRAIKERQDLIVDGVHVLSTQLDLASLRDKALVVPIMLVVATRDDLINRFAARGSSQPGRGVSRYLEHIDEIWELQSFLLRQAETADVPLVINRTPEDTVLQILGEVSREVAVRYPADVATLS